MEGNSLPRFLFSHKLLNFKEHNPIKFLKNVFFFFIDKERNKAHLKKKKKRTIVYHLVPLLVKNMILLKVK